MAYRRDAVVPAISSQPELGKSQSRDCSRAAHVVVVALFVDDDIAK